MRVSALFVPNQCHLAETTLRRDRARTRNGHRAAGRNEVYADHWVTNIRGRSNPICPIPARTLESFATH
jgi:hypothetical protein